METSIELDKHTEQNGDDEFHLEQVLTIVGGHFTHDSYSAFVATLLPLIIEKLSLSLTLAGTLLTLLQLPSILNPFIGYLADRISMRYFVIFAPAATATFICALGFADSTLSVAVVLLLTGFSSAAFHSAAPAMIGRISGNRIGRGMSYFMAGGELARTVGPLVAVWAVGLWGLEGIYRLVFVGWASSLLLFWRLREVSARAEKVSGIREITPRLLRFFLPLILVVFLRMYLATSLSAYLPTYMVASGYSVTQAGIYLAILEFAGVGGALFSGTLSDRVGRKPLLAIAFLVSSLLTLVFLNISGNWIVPILLLLGFSALSTGPLFLALVQDHLPEHRAVGNGLYLSASFLVRSLAMLMIGIIGDSRGLDTAFLWSALLSLLAIPVLYLIPKANVKSAA